MSMDLVARAFRCKLDKTRLVILMALCDSAEDDGSACFPRPEYVAWKAGVSRATVYRVLENLEAHGIIERAGMHGATVEYHIHIERAQPKAPPPRPKGMGRPRKVVSPCEKFSHGEKSPSHGEESFLTMRKVSGDTKCPEPRPRAVKREQASPRTQSLPSQLPSPYSSAEPGEAAQAPRESDSFKYGWLAEHPLYRAALDVLDAPTTDRERGRWAVAIKSMQAGGVTPARLLAAADAWRAVYPKAEMTITGLDGNLSILTPQWEEPDDADPDPDPTAPGEPPRPHDQHRRRTEAERAAAWRRADEEAARQLIAEICANGPGAPVPDE